MKTLGEAAKSALTHNLYDWRVEQIRRHAEVIGMAKHLFSGPFRHDPIYERIDLRSSASELEAAAKRLREIADELEPKPEAAE